MLLQGKGALSGLSVKCVSMDPRKCCHSGAEGIFYSGEVASCTGAGLSAEIGVREVRNNSCNTILCVESIMVQYLR